MAATKTGGNVLVWGALGFMGQHLVPRLLDRGATVSVLTRSRRLSSLPPWVDQVQWFELSEENSSEGVIDAAVASASVIYDFAGSSGATLSNQDPLGSLDANCRSQLQLLKACDRASRRPHIVFTSSWLVYGDTGSGAVAEDHPTQPRSMYAAHKLCIEKYLHILARRSAITHTVCRISNPYGVDRSRTSTTYKVLNLFIKRALAGEPITLFGDGRQQRDFIYISDLIQALLLCGFSPNAHNQLFNISRGKSYAMADAVNLVRELTGSSSPVLFKPWPEEYRVVESGDYLADIAKAKTILGFAPTYDLREGLEATIQEYLQPTSTERERLAFSGAKSHAAAGPGS